MAVLDADKERFVRSKSSLIQVAGRAARNVNGKVILYGDKITDAMENLMQETNRRRALQDKYNIENNITPETISKSTDEILLSTSVAGSDKDEKLISIDSEFQDMTIQDRENILIELRKEMIKSAENLDFEKAAKLRDEIERFEDSAEEAIN